MAPALLIFRICGLYFLSIGNTILKDREYL